MEYIWGSYRCANKKKYITVQQAKASAKLSNSKLPLGKPVDVHDAA